MVREKLQALMDDSEAMVASLKKGSGFKQLIYLLARG